MLHMTMPEPVASAILTHLSQVRHLVSGAVHILLLQSQNSRGV